MLNRFLVYFSDDDINNEIQEGKTLSRGESIRSRGTATVESSLWVFFAFFNPPLRSPLNLNEKRLSLDTAAPRPRSTRPNKSWNKHQLLQPPRARPGDVKEQTKKIRYYLYKFVWGSKF